MSVAAVVRKEFHQIGRDRRTLGVLVFLPLFLLLMFGYAVSLDVRNASLAIVDLDHSADSRAIVAAFAASPEYFDIRYRPHSPTDLRDLFMHGEILGAVVIPQGFSRDFGRGERPGVQLLVDGTNGTTASALQGYMQAVVTGTVADRVAAGGRAPAGAVAPVEERPRVWFNPELESNRYLIPGLVAFILVITAVISTALSLVREKELGTLEQISASPMRPVALIIGKTIPYIVISVVIAAGIFLAGWLMFGVGVAGSVLWLATGTVLFLFASLGLGILISSIADTQQVAFMISILVTFLPAFILSGFIFPIRNMPLVIQAVTYIVPARYYIAALRAIMLKGAGVGVFWPDLVFLMAFSVVTVTAGVVRLRTRSVLA